MGCGAQYRGRLQSWCEPFQLEGGPKWIDDFSPDKYDIVAKAAGPAAQDQLMLMLQTLLEDRFKLKYHFETKQLPIYELIVANKGVLGPNLHKPDTSDARYFPIRHSPGSMDAANATMQDLAFSLSSFTGDRLVLDRTGLVDHFAFTLEFTPDPAALYMRRRSAFRSIGIPAHAPTTIDRASWVNTSMEIWAVPEIWGPTWNARD